MEKSGRGHQRTRKVLSSFPAEGLYDIVVDSRLQKILEAAEKMGLNLNDFLFVKEMDDYL